jgi:hypothetical protein
MLMNNSLHDISIAIFFASGIAMWLTLKNLKDKKDEYFSKLSCSIRRIGSFSLYLILFSSIPRILAFKDFELAHAISKDRVTGLIVRHIIAFLFVTAGIYLWIKINARIKNSGNND